MAACLTTARPESLAGRTPRGDRGVQLIQTSDELVVAVDPSRAGWPPTVPSTWRVVLSVEDPEGVVRCLQPFQLGRSVRRPRPNQAERLGDLAPQRVAWCCPDPALPRLGNRHAAQAEIVQGRQRRRRSGTCLRRDSAAGGGGGGPWLSSRRRSCSPDAFVRVRGPVAAKSRIWWK
jgi:hypothetical protein